MIKYAIGNFVFGEEEKKAVEDVVKSNRISEGPKVKEFEKNWSNYINTKYAIATNSGTSALMCGLSALKYYKDLKKKRKVITTPLTYASTINALVTTSFEPVFVDASRDTLNINPESIKEYFENNDDGDCSIVLPVHLMGYPCDMDAINKVCRDHDLICFEDCAEAHGSVYKGKRVGSIGLLAIFSFYVSHNISAGEMGAITTSNSQLNDTIREIKNHGMRKGSHALQPFYHSLIGFNFKTTEFSAAIALTQLKKADFILKKRQDNVKYLNEGLAEFSDILQLPKFSRDVGYLAYPLVVKRSISREKIRTELEKKGVETRPLFGCIPTQQPAYAYLKKQYEGKLPHAEFLGKNGFYIGCHQYLSTQDLDYAINAFKDVLKKLT